MITLTTERLLLRPFTGDDLDEYARICSDPEVMRYIGSGQPLSRAEAWRQIAFLAGHWHLRGHGTWAVVRREDDRLLGRAGLHYPEGWPGLEVGWLLDRAAWGQGYAREAGEASLRHAFTTVGADHVISVIHPANERSLRVAGRLGMRFERFDLVSGINVAIYGIARAAHPAAPPV